MNFDFLYHSYTLIITIFAAVFGMAYPLMLQAIERIDDKYTSSVLATDLRKRWQFRTFNVLIIVCILCVAILAYTIKSTEHPQWKYVEVSLATILIVALMVDAVLLVRQILTFYSPKELYEQLLDNLNNRNAEALYDLARFSEKTDDYKLYISCMSAVNRLFLDEQEKSEEGKPVEYSVELYAILDRISKKVADTSQTDDRYNNVGVIQVLYNSDRINGIPTIVYQSTWLMQNRAAKAGNTGWFRDYWTYAEQYYRFQKYKANTPEAKASLAEFYRYHVMTGALLVYFKRYEWLKHIMRYSQEQLGLPQYILIPGTLSRIFEVVRYLEALSDQPFGLYHKYQIMGLDRGVQTDEAIAEYAYQYLALLVIRIWSYRDYNYNYANPLDIPMVSDESVEDNDEMIICVNRLKKAVDGWYKDGLLKDLGLHDIPEQKEVVDKLDEYILALKMKVTEITARTDVDPEKTETIKNEIIVSNANSLSRIPMKRVETAVDLSIYLSYSKLVIASESIEREYITKGSKKSIGNFGSCLVTKLNYNLLGEYLKAISQMMPPDIIYRVNQKDLLGAIDKMALPEGYAIMEWGDAFGMYELRKRMTYHHNEVSYKHLKVYSLGVTGYSAEVLIVNENEIPFIEITDTAVNSAEFEVIDEMDCLYSNIDHIEFPFEVKLMQSINVYALKEHSPVISLEVQHDFGEDKYDFDNIQSRAILTLSGQNAD